MAMRARVTRKLLISISVLAAIGASAPAKAQETRPQTIRPATLPADLRPVQEKVDIPALIRDVEASEDWMDKAQSFRVTMQWTETRSPEMLAARKALFQKLMPGADLNADKLAGQLASETFRTEIAFDQTRVFYRRTSLDEGTYQMQTWDGRQLTEASKATRTAEPRVSPPSTNPPGPQGILYDLSCFRLNYHPLWTARQHQSEQRPSQRPESFQLLGQVTYHGTDCYLLDNPSDYERWFVGVKDHRIYGVTISVVPRELLSQVDSILSQLAIERTGKSATMDHLEVLAKLTPDQRADFSRELGRRVAHLATPLSEHWMTDYKEIAPGVFFPMTQGVTFFPTRPGESYSRTGSIAEVELNQPLPDDLFQ